MPQHSVSGPIIYHIPVCPFSQRVEILVALKGISGQIHFEVVDITRPRPDWLLDLTRGRTALPVMHMPDGQVLPESLSILREIEALYPKVPIARVDQAERRVEDALIALAEPLVNAGYTLVMNQDRKMRGALIDGLLAAFARIDDFLCTHSPVGTYLFERYGLAEAVFTPVFQRFWFLQYYERFTLPSTSRFGRVARWIDACLDHPAAQQVTREEIIKVYYDYALGAGNGALVPGRSMSSFAFAPHWSLRPWPPADKYLYRATDRQLGLVADDGHKPSSRSP